MKKRLIAALASATFCICAAAQTIPTEVADSLAALPELERYRSNRAAAAKKDIYGHRPTWHFTSPESILHDPNGLCFWQGRWHMFYQAFPFADPRQCWGHAVSDDLIHWKDLPIVFRPEVEDYCYSGATFPEKDRVIAAWYGRPVGEIVACSSDPLLLNWNRISDRPVIEKPEEGSKPYDTFDPFVWKDGDWYYMMSGLYMYDGPGGKRKSNAFLFRSKNLKDWKYLHSFIENDCYTCIGGDCACPYFWPIGNNGKYILVNFNHKAGAEYLIGDYDRKRQKFVVTDGGRLNQGPEGDGGTHAPSCYPDGKGGIVCIFNAKGKDIAHGTYTQCMTLPRLLSLGSDGRLIQDVTGDYMTLRGESVEMKNIRLESPAQETVLEEIRGKSLEIEMEFAPGTPSIELDVLRSPDRKEFTRIIFFRNGGMPDRFYPDQNNRYSALTIDTSFGSVHPGTMRHIPETTDVYLEKDEALKLHVFIDRTIVEVFINGKQAAMLRTWPVLEKSATVSVRTLSAPTEIVSAKAWKMSPLDFSLRGGYMERSLEKPEAYKFGKSCKMTETISLDEFDIEYLVQKNGAGTSQRVLKVFPKNFSGKIPAVVVPFYFPEAMLGFDPRTGEKLAGYAGIEMMTHLARRGIASISGESYHLTYIDSEKPRDDFSRWQDAGQKLNRDWPIWSGMGKLVSDTRLLIDLLEEDPRIDVDRIGIAGHSLGGKTAFYTGCLDPRVKVILASDFGFLWEQSNWEKCWYWGNKLERLKAEGLDNTSLLSESHGKPFFLIAGKFDDERSHEAMLRAEGYGDCPERLGFLNHATGHRPPMWALEKGYEFIEKYLTKK